MLKETEKRQIVQNKMFYILAQQTKANQLLQDGFGMLELTNYPMLKVGTGCYY